MEDIITKLGPTKVTATIRSNGFAQGFEYVTGDSLLQDLYDPHAMFESMRGKKHTSVNGATMTCNNTNNNNSNNSNNNNTAIKTMIAPSHVSEQVLVDDGKYEWFVKHGNTFMFLALYNADPVVTVLKLADAHLALERFVGDCKANLDGTAQLYKKYGFNRKRGMTVSGLQEALVSDLAHNDEAYTFIAKLLNVHLILYNVSFHERRDYNDGDDSLRQLMILRMLDNTHRQFKESSPDAIRKELYRVHSDSTKTIPDEDSKLAELRGFAKAVGIKATNKKDVLAALENFKN